MSPSISVITPIKARNAQESAWLSYAIQSVLDQTHEDWELIIVDDSSTAELPVTDDPRIRWATSGGLGCAASRNMAASRAEAPLLLPLDADDKLARNAMEIMLKEWEAGGEEAGFVYSDVMVFGSDFARLIVARDYDFDYLLKSTYIPVGALHKKADWERVGGWKTEMEYGLEDWEYWIALGELGVCGWRVEQPLYWYRRHPDSRLSRLRAAPENWGKAYGKLRDLHRDTYRGRKPMGCCGGSRRQRVPLPPREQRIEPVIRGKTVLMEYTGRREGSFFVKGFESGIRYRIPGRGARFKVDARDLPRMMSQPSIQQVKEQPRTMPKRAEVDQAIPPVADSKTFDATLMDEKPAELQVPDPGGFSVPFMRSAEFDVSPQVAAKMIELEKAGKNRKTALRALKRKL